jgi:hypothetical protein
VLRLGHTSVTVPAGGTAAVPVILTPARAAVGLYSGRLDARSADGTVVLTTALGAYEEPESYDMAFTALDSRGQAADYSFVFVADAATGDISLVELPDGTGVLRRRAGAYVVLATISGTDDLTTEARRVSLRGPTEITLDARRSNALTLSAAADADAVPDGLAFLTTDVELANSGFGAGLIAPVGILRVTPTRGRIAGLDWGFFAELHKAGTASLFGSGPPSPYVYHGAFHGVGTLPGNPHFRFTAANTATVTHHLSRQGATALRSFGAESTNPSGGMGAYWDIGDLTRRTDHYAVAPDLTWDDRLTEGTPTPGGDFDGADIISLPAPHRVGEHGTEVWDAGAFGPAPTFAERYGDTLDFALPLVTDSAPRHLGLPESAHDHGTATLYRGSTVVATSDVPAFLTAEGVPAAMSEYRLVAEDTRDAPWTQFASRVRAEWTFRSGHAADHTMLALPTVRFRPRLDALNRAPATGTFAVPVTVERPYGPAPDVTAVGVQVSYDDGATWTDVPLTGSGATRTATLTHPGHAGFVSLRATASTAGGVTVTQTTVHAYALA